MANTYKVSIEFEFEIEASAGVSDEATAINFANEATGGVMDYFATMAKDPKYLGPDFKVFPKRETARID